MTTTQQDTTTALLAPTVPGRQEQHEAGALTRLLFETARRHAALTADRSPYDWRDWYGAFVTAREQGDSPEQAAVAAGRHMDEVRHAVAFV